MTTLRESLQKYAQLIIHVGLNLQKGQPLIINNASTKGVPLHAAPLVREVTRAAYEAGSPYVEVLWNDEELIRLPRQVRPRWHIRRIFRLDDPGPAQRT